MRFPEPRTRDGFSGSARLRTHGVLGILGFLALLGASGETSLAQSPSPPPPPPPAAAAPARADLTAARELVKAAKYDEADKALTELQATFPDDPSLLLLRGEILNTTGHPDQAVPLLRHAAEVAPAKKRVHFQLGTALSTTGDAVGALAAFGKELEVNPDPKIAVMSRLNRTILFEKNRQFDEAAAEMERVLEAEPDRKDAYGDLAGLYLDAGKPAEAARTVERAEAAGLQSARLHFRMGVAYFKLKDFDKAATSFDRTLEIQPELAAAELNLAQALDQLGRKTEADAHFRRYLELEPKAPEAAEIRKRLQASPASKPKTSKS